ncbi:uncharacterized protein LOC128991303 [Macrosteles quadrilineatus]|uniref:uncharacterized protein LOC128991303 n=1 Tax=Macrosteles quadrilineatus TaxID=74068 RepID=UPI0023E162BC|nr:uncharacterized protein LOC128991303 [Macrosteles quadrilineatus]
MDISVNPDSNYQLVSAAMYSFKLFVFFCTLCAVVLAEKIINNEAEFKPSEITEHQTKIASQNGSPVRTKTVLKASTIAKTPTSEIEDQPEPDTQGKAKAARCGGGGKGGKKGYGGYGKKSWGKGK